jgi:DHA1 family inner membrane transport protein
MNHRLSRFALMLGNFVVGTGILLPAGMLKELAAGPAGSIPQAGLLVTYGAVVLCIGSPLVAWWTSRIDRRLLLAGTLAILALGHAGSVFAPNYAVLLALRVAMLAVAAIYTPQAASTVALTTPEAERPRAIAFVFLGWSLSVAAGLPLVAFIAAHFGWQAAYAAVAAACAAGFVLLLVALPAGLLGAAVSLASWGQILGRRPILLLLLLTTLQIAGQFVLFTYLSPLLSRLAGASVAAISAFFAIFGIAGFVGNVIATQIVAALDPFRTSWLFLASIFAGMTIWTFGAGSLVAMGVGVTLWGLGFAAVNSMQQARLVGAAPALASASVALNTSSIYVGQAIGSAFGGVLIAHDHPIAMGYAAMVLVAGALGVLALTDPKN